MLSKATEESVERYLDKTYEAYVHDLARKHLEFGQPYEKETDPDDDFLEEAISHLRLEEQ